MNKLHEALKNEELMLEVGRKATEEQKVMTQQSTVEELVEFEDGYKFTTPLSDNHSTEE